MRVEVGYRMSPFGLRLYHVHFTYIQPNIYSQMVKLVKIVYTPQIKTKQKKRKKKKRKENRFGFFLKEMQRPSPPHLNNAMSLLHVKVLE